MKFSEAVLLRHCFHNSDKKWKSGCAAPKPNSEMRTVGTNGPPDGFGWVSGGGRDAGRAGFMFGFIAEFRRMLWRKGQIGCGQIEFLADIEAPGLRKGTVMLHRRFAKEMAATVTFCGNVEEGGIGELDPPP